MQYHSYYDHTSGKYRRVQRGPESARKEIDRFNKLSNEIEHLEERLRDTERKREQARMRAFAALPPDDSYGISMGDRLELAGPF